MEGHESVVKRLSDGQDVKPNKLDSGGIIPPSWVLIEKRKLVGKGSRAGKIFTRVGQIK